MTDGRYRLLGGPGSPYSHKVRAVLRYRRIPHDWIVPMGAFTGGGVLGGGSELDRAGKGMVPVLQYPEDGSYHADSTPLIYDLERRHPGERSVIPPDPGRAFVAHLIEDLADEWLPLPMFYLRWTEKEDIEFCGLRQMAGWLGPVDDATLAEAADRFRERQRGIVQGSGLGAIPREQILAQYQRVREILERDLARSLFLFGDRPSIAEFGLYGQLTQYIVDPTVSTIMRQTAPRLYQWVHLMDDTSGIDGEWDPPDSDWAPAVRGLLELSRDVHLPQLAVFLEARKASGEAETGVAGRGTYKADCLLWLKQELSELTGEPRDRVESLLRETGCFEPLQFGEGERELLSPMTTL